MINTTIQQKVHNICQKAASHLANPTYVTEISLRRENAIDDHNSYLWNPLTLSQGYPGLIILFSEMEYFFPSQGWQKISDNYINLLIQELQKDPIIHPSLFLGLAGICYALHLGTQNDSQYLHHSDSIHSFLLKQIEKHFLLFTKEPEESLKPMEYDVIFGISGILSYLLNYKHQEQTKNIIYKLLVRLVKLAFPIELKEEKHGIPGWHIPVRNLILKEHKDMYPNGCFDTGIAHGISGCLAILAKAYMGGMIVDKQEEAIRNIVNWLKITQQTVGPYDHTWPKRYAFNPKKENDLEIKCDVYFDGWCYGAPGILNALILASSALQDKCLYQDCISDLLLTAKRLHTSKSLNCASFCHGWSSPLTILHQMSLATSIDLFSQETKKIVEVILEEYNETFDFGFKCVAPTNNLNDIRRIENPGLLNGVSGILLSLLFFTSKIPRPWMKIFLLN